MNMSAGAGSERFQSGANKYAAYLETPEDRLRSDLPSANLHDFLPQEAGQSFRALDLGCGTGATAVRLARLGIHVTAVDCSAAMLDIAQRAAHEAGVAEKMVVKHGEAAQLASLFDPRSFDLILCHNILEYVDDPGAVLRDSARALRGSSAIVSVLVRGQAGDVLKSAIRTGDLDEAEKGLTAEWGKESLYGGRLRRRVRRSIEGRPACRPRSIQDIACIPPARSGSTLRVLPLCVALAHVARAKG
jgi:S-adenosylmethionine-dependent methyltransferase